MEYCVHLFFKRYLCSFAYFSAFGEAILLRHIVTKLIHVCTGEIVLTVTAVLGLSYCLLFRIEDKKLLKKE